MKVSAFAIDFEGSLADLILAPVKLAGLYAQAVQRAEKMGFKDYQLSLNSNFSSSCSLSCRVPRSVPRDCVRGLQCSSCDVNLSLATLLGASAKSPLDDIPNSVLLLLAGEHARAWLDAKKRAMVVVTPKRHVERISELEGSFFVFLFFLSKSKKKGNELELCMKDLAKALEHCAHSITRIVVNQV
jgi:hypothetical protein